MSEEKRYLIVEPDFDNPNKAIEVVVSENEIKTTYVPYWIKRWKNKYPDTKLSYEEMVDMAITDWIVINWACEI